MQKLLKERYGLTNYQIALLRYLFITLISEGSKMFFIIFLYQKQLALCIATMLFLCCIRRCAGGFHCSTYIGCLIVSTSYIILCISVLPQFHLQKQIQLLLCIVCICINYLFAPLSSPKRPALSDNKKEKLKYISTAILIIFFFALVIAPENTYIKSLFGVVILHAVQLSCAVLQKNMCCMQRYDTGKEFLMNTQTETVSPVKMLLEQLARISKWGGTSGPSIFLFGEYDFPKEEDYIEE